MKLFESALSWRRTCAIIALAFSMSASANSSRLTVLNETIDPALAAQSTFDLYLSRLGTYYAELYLERDGESAPPGAPVAVDLSLAFVRGDEVVFERDVSARFETGQPVTTLLLLDIPRDLPQRKALDMVVTLRGLAPAPGEPLQTLRLQLTRKPQLLPLRR